VISLASAITFRGSQTRFQSPHLTSHRQQSRLDWKSSNCFTIVASSPELRKRYATSLQQKRWKFLVEKSANPPFVDPSVSEFKPSFGKTKNFPTPKVLLALVINNSLVENLSGTDPRGYENSTGSPNKVRIHHVLARAYASASDPQSPTLHFIHGTCPSNCCQYSCSRASMLIC
jgi:hypothetical protein